MDALDLDLARTLHSERTRALEERHRHHLEDSVPTGALVHTRRR